MAQQETFGRKAPQSAAPKPVRRPDGPEPLSPELAAFAKSIRSARDSDVDEFARWRREQLPRRLSVILVGIALMTPGLVCLIAQAPLWVSLGLEAAGLAANVWLRHERRRQASDIAGWTPGN
jgi:hypothetical protein